MDFLHYNQDYRETITLNDGTKALLRCVRPEDKQLLREGLQFLSPDARYRRFFSPKNTLSDRELVFLTEVDGIDHVAIGAVRSEADRDVGLGIARFIRRKDQPDTAEPAIAVIDAVQGLGLGSALFLRLMAAAREREISRFRGEILATNEPIKHLLKDLNDQVRFESRGREEMLDFPIPDFTPSRLESHPSLGDNAFSGLLQAINAGTVLLRNTLQSLRDLFGA